MNIYPKLLPVKKKYIMDFDKLASYKSVAATAKALSAKGYLVDIVDNINQALEKIKEIIPPGASVMNGSSRTLEQIGFVDFLKSGKHSWNNLHGKIFAEKDASRQSHLRKTATLSDYYLGSVHALVKNGEFVIASNTGSQLPNIVYSSTNLVFVVSTKKIVGTLDQAFRRLENYVIPLEDAHMKDLYGMGTTLNKLLIFKGEPQFLGRKIRFILVNEALGF
ncbi:hypothetical protein A3D78_01250 [Candidatus Gottesmanbacteria bacterium RIFCSPHIGHO2_02_FULL_39_14]|uniref:LUD domain-containing protein n=2 Tax=Candidatus Gottesmaniibacteriota TaxID=1752720 RepID=A0A1F6A3P0_9BACT|nr:MAG: hypothetical protein A3D78_01250 [Candidatus Gottesmanbacteria bacterium RIFCSPHIGHO2_02_FULL_39_14]